MSDLISKDNPQPPSPDINLEERTSKLLDHVTKADFDSFQEYGYIARQSGKGFKIEKARVLDMWQGEQSRADLDDLLQVKSRTRGAAPVVSALEDFFNVPKALYDGGIGSRSKGILYCIVGKMGGSTVIQGGGNIHPDMVGRTNASAYKLVFDRADSANQFIDWLQENPNQALSSLLERIIGNYIEGEFQGTLLPQNKVRTSSRESTNPFAVPIRELELKFLDTQQSIHKNFEGTEQYSKDKAELEALMQAEYERRKTVRNAQKPEPSPIQSSMRPQSLDNPSGLNPDAPLTKIINAIIRAIKKPSSGKT